MKSYYKYYSMSSRLRKWLPIIIQISLTKRQRWVRVSVISVHSIAILLSFSYCDNAHAVCGICAQLSTYVEVCTYVLQATESWVGTWEQDCSTQCESESCLPIITARKRSIFCCGAMLYVATVCTSRAIYDHYLTESAPINDLGLNLTKFAWGSMPPPR